VGLLLSALRAGRWKYRSIAGAGAAYQLQALSSSGATAAQRSAANAGSVILTADVRG